MTGQGKVDFPETWAKLRTLEAEGGQQEYSLGVGQLAEIKASITMPDGTLGLFLRYPGEISLDNTDLSGSQDVDIEHSYNPSKGESTVRLSLNNPKSEPLFNTLCSHILPRVENQTTPEGQALALIRGFNDWKQFLKQSGSRGLSAERQRGLFGELITLHDLLIPVVGSNAALKSWTGPENRPQDFQISELAIETKTLIQSEPQQFRINNERQLDDWGLRALLMAHHRLFQHEGGGQTLPEMVDAVTELIEQGDGDVREFEAKLLKAGYTDFHREKYLTTGYSLKETRHYHVRDGFPRLTEDSLVTGVGDVSYLLDASACEKFEVAEETVTAWLVEPPEPIDPSTTDESRDVEYKQTAWTPVEEPNNDEHRNAVEVDLKIAVIKTVVAFLNTDGGELVIGVHDETKEITGIEVDLARSGKSEKDHDFYERELVTLLSNHIDDNVLNSIRIHFKTAGEKTACHVQVRRSINPRWGTPPLKSGEQPQQKFWVRAGNTTKELTGDSIIKHIEEQRR